MNNGVVGEHRSSPRYLFFALANSISTPSPHAA